MTTINIYRSNGDWYGARWIDGEYDGSDLLEAETEAEAYAEAAQLADPVEVRRVPDVEAEARATYFIEARDSHGNWDARHAGEPVRFASEAEALAEIPRLAAIQESPESDYRVTEATS